MTELTPPPEAVAFWEKHIYGRICALCKGTYSLSEIQTRFAENRWNMKCRYKTDTLQLIPSLEKWGVRAPLACSVTQGIPTINFNMIELMGGIKKLQLSNPVTADELFETTLVIAFMHETDHLALGLIDTSSFPARMYCERHTWAKTCEYTMRPVIEIHRKKVLRTNREIYNAWVTCGRNPESSQWQRNIEKLYRETLTPQ